MFKDVKASSSLEKYLASINPVFYRINRETIDYKGFECYMITLRQEFVNLESKSLRKKIHQQEFILPAVAHEMRAPIGITMQMLNDLKICNTRNNFNQESERSQPGFGNELAHGI